ncbi:MAG: phosphoenolpyruvate synthase, partial [Chloroflexota bacterium]
NRKITSIDASFGLGEALVSGIVDADGYKIREGKIVEKKISDKKLAIVASRNGGVTKLEIEPELRNVPALTDEQILELVRHGRAIEAHLGCPQDIEWCLAEGEFYIVQSRPITTIFPIPQAGDDEYRVYISVGHQQMMTDPIKPLGLSFFLMTTPATMRVAAGRLFVDITQSLASPAKRAVLLDSKGPFLGQHDPLLSDALNAILERGDFDNSTDIVEKESKSPEGDKPKSLMNSIPSVAPTSTLVSELIRNNEASLLELKRVIPAKSGVELFDFIREDLAQLKRNIFEPRSMDVIMAAFRAASWLNENIYNWLGEKNVADALSQSAPNNVTSEMGLALMDVADAVRPYPQIVEYLKSVESDDFLDGLGGFYGGKEIKDVIEDFLEKYGARCVGEIDVTRDRWIEKPSALIPMILNNIKNFEPRESARMFERGLQGARNKEREILDRLKTLPEGEEKAAEAKRMIEQLRSLTGYREFPKYCLISRYFVHKRALLREAEKLLEGGVIRKIEDIFYLSFEELREVVRTNSLDRQIIEKRREDYALFEKLTPPRVITSDGEIVRGSYRREGIPAGTLPGLAVSAGVVEGRARVVKSVEDAIIETGDILVTAFTDPSWTPLFVSIKGLVTEVGGLMTHGAVIAREYGLPAVIGVENATRLIKDGQRIRVNGTEGHVEILSDKED